MVMREVKMAKTFRIGPIVTEVETVEEANDLYASGEWGKPRYSEKRDKYVMVRRDVKLLEDR